VTLLSACMRVGIIVLFLRTDCRFGETLFAFSFLTRFFSLLPRYDDLPRPVGRRARYPLQPMLYAVFFWLSPSSASDRITFTSRSFGASQHSPRASHRPFFCCSSLTKDPPPACSPSSPTKTPVFFNFTDSHSDRAPSISFFRPCERALGCFPPPGAAGLSVCSSSAPL